MPLGEKILDYVDSHDIDREVKEGAKTAVNFGQKAYHRVSDTISGASSDSPSAPGDRDARTLLAEARDRAAREARKAKLEAQSTGKDIQEHADSLIDRAKAAAQKAEEEIRAKLNSASSSASNAADDAKSEVKSLGEGVKAYFGNHPNTEEGKPRPILGSSSSSSKKPTTTPNAAPAKPWTEPLPLNHEAPVGYSAPRSDRPLTPSTNAALRPDPGAPKLPKLAPAISQLSASASEPVISQLASTIDDLAEFIKGAPATSSFQAKDVLNLARADLEKLTDRLDAIKRKEADRVDRMLKSQQTKFEDDLKREQERAEKELGRKDEEWHKNMEKERQKQMKDYQDKLEKELATQSEIINERLREEIIAQGIELQRRWMRDIKARVEQERGGRLARLDELASQVQHLENVARQNSRDLDQSAGVNTLLATVRALQAVVDSPGLYGEGEDASVAKRPFRQELRRLRASPAVADSEVIRNALDFLESSSLPDEGVDSFLTLSAWFQDKVAPAILKTALLPDDGGGSSAGVVSHLTSAALSPLLFKKKGNVEGNDVPSILARAEYHLQREDLDAAARQVNQLKGWGKILANDWLDAARKRLEAKQALEVVGTEASYKSLLHA